MKKSRKFITEGNCSFDGAPYRKKAGLWVCSKCGKMRPLEYENNPYYSGLVIPTPSESVGYGSRKLPTDNT